MDVASFNCEVSGCSEISRKQVNIEGFKILLCHKHDKSQHNSDPVYILSHTDKVSLMKLIHQIKINIKTLRSDVIKKTEKIVEIVNQVSIEAMKEFNKLENKCNELIQNLISQPYCFSKIIENINANANFEISRAELDLGKVYKILKFYALGSCNHLSFSKTEAVSVLGKAKRENNFLADARIFDSSVDVGKKLKILSKTCMVMNIDYKNPDLKYMPKESEFLNLILSSPTHIALSQKRSYIITGHLDSQVYIRSLSNPSIPINEDFIYHNQQVEGEKLLELLIDQNEDLLFIIAVDRILCINLETLSICNKYTHNHGLLCICKPFCNNTKVALSNYDGYIWVFDLSQFLLIASCRAHEGCGTVPIKTINVSNTGNFIIFADKDSEIKLWTYSENNNKVVKLPKPKSPVVHLAFSPNNQYVVGLTKNNEVKLWDCFDKFNLVLSVSTKIEKISSIWFSKDFLEVFVYNGRKGEAFRMVGKKVSSIVVEKNLAFVSSLFVNTR